MNTLISPLTMVRPAQIEFGVGTAPRLGAWAGARGYKNILVVADAFNATRVDVLELPGTVIVLSDVTPEPDIANLERLLAAAQHNRCDLVVGFGGGSAMDLAKLVSVLAGGDQSLADVVGANKVVRPRRAALAQVPTTAGTGSEAGVRALITDPATATKLAVESHFMLADIAIIDPGLTFTLPAHITAATGVDAMAHCVESYTSRKSHPMVDHYAIEGFRLVGKYLARAVRDGADAEARAGLSLASLYGGYCLGPVNTAGGHALSYPLGSRWHVPHGAANALIFPHVLAFNAPAVPEKTEVIMAALGGPGTTSSAEVLAHAHAFCAGLGIEMTLSGLGVPQTDLDTMTDDAFAIRRLLDNNPRDIPRDAIRAIYQAAY